MSDFERNVWCLLGIPVDAIDFNGALQVLDRSRNRGERCFFSTPNLNFIVEAHKNDAFRESVLASDLVLVDGMPPVWIARMVGIEGIEKVSGSNLMEHLLSRNPEDDAKLRVFLFGGDEGVGEAACNRINSTGRGLECVGWYNPGFGTVAEMSSADILERINASGAEFVLVSLGAQKGQAWIMANAGKLSAPLISHLGAVINFFAGSVARAPRWMQSLGLEWLWRISQEPALWRRYFFDGIYFCRKLLPGVLCYRFWRLLNRGRLASASSLRIIVESRGDEVLITLEGDCLAGNTGEFREKLPRIVAESRSVVLDLSRVSLADGVFLGLCLMLYRQTAMAGGSLAITGFSPEIRRIFRWNAVEWLL